MLIQFRHSLSYFVIGSVPSALHLVTAMQQRTFSNFGVRNDVQMLSGRWLREPSPDYMREGFPCKTCGQRFKSKQGLASHSKHVHNEVREAKAQDGANPHWAWRFLQGAQPHADDAQEPVVVGGADPFSTPEKKRGIWLMADVAGRHVSATVSLRSCMLWTTGISHGRVASSTTRP